MSEQTSVFALLKDVMHDHSSGRLLRIAQAVMDNHGQGVLDPIHFIYGAAVDDHAPKRVKVLFAQHNINRGTVQAAVRHIRPVEHVSTRGAHGAHVEFVNADTMAVLKALESRRKLYIDRRCDDPLDSTGAWCWYTQLVLVAVESEGPAVTALLGPVERR